MSTYRPLIACLVVSAAAVVAVGPTASPASASDSCYARNGHLYCGNVYDASVKQVPAYSRAGVPVPTVDHLRSTFSYFQCYTVGQRHSGGNSIWYRTYGDVTSRWGYVAAAAVFTDRDPYPGVAPC